MFSKKINCSVHTLDYNSAHEALSSQTIIFICVKINVSYIKNRITSQEDIYYQNNLERQATLRFAHNPCKYLVNPIVTHVFY